MGQSSFKMNWIRIFNSFWKPRIRLFISTPFKAPSSLIAWGFINAYSTKSLHFWKETPNAEGNTCSHPDISPFYFHKETYMKNLYEIQTNQTGELKSKAQKTMDKKQVNGNKQDSKIVLTRCYNHKAVPSSPLRTRQMPEKFDATHKNW